jgi:large subunit ribosomal protein L25
MTISFDLKADLRSKLGSSESRRVRKSGGIPAIIYGGKENTNITVPAKEFEREYLKGDIHTTVFNLDINGKKQKAVLNKLDLNAVTDKPSHVTFVEAEEGSKVKVKVKVRFFNREKSPGIKKGGFLHISTRKVELLCPVNEIPEEITYDVSKMRVGNKVVSTDLELPQNISFAQVGAFNIASIIGRGAKEEEGVVNADGEAPVEGGVAAEGEEGEEGGGKEESK